MWEMLHRGSISFEIENNDITKMKELLLNKTRPPINTIYDNADDWMQSYIELMKHCWHHDDSQRPSISQALHRLISLKNQLNTTQSSSNSNNNSNSGGGNDNSEETYDNDTITNIIPSKTFEELLRDFNDQLKLQQHHQQLVQRSTAVEVANLRTTITIEGVLRAVIKQPRYSSDVHYSGSERMIVIGSRQSAVLIRMFIDGNFNCKSTISQQKSNTQIEWNCLAFDRQDSRRIVIGSSNGELLLFEITQTKEHHSPLTGRLKLDSKVYHFELAVMENQVKLMYNKTPDDSLRSSKSIIPDRFHSEFCRAVASTDDQFEVSCMKANQALRLQIADETLITANEKRRHRDKWIDEIKQSVYGRCIDKLLPIDTISAAQTTLNEIRSIETDCNGNFWLIDDEYSLVLFSIDLKKVIRRISLEKLAKYSGINNDHQHHQQQQQDHDVIVVDKSKATKGIRLMKIIDKWKMILVSLNGMIVLVELDQSNDQLPIVIAQMESEIVKIELFSKKISKDFISFVVVSKMNEIGMLFVNRATNYIQMEDNKEIIQSELKILKQSKKKNRKMATITSLLTTDQRIWIGTEAGSIFCATLKSLEDDLKLEQLKRSHSNAVHEMVLVGSKMWSFGKDGEVFVWDI